MTTPIPYNPDRRRLIAGTAGLALTPAAIFAQERVPAMTTVTLQALADRLEIVDLVNRSAFAADRRDWVTARACFADRVNLDYTSLVGGQPAVVEADAMIASWRSSLPGFDATQHIITNHVVTVSGERAECQSHFRAQHRIGSGPAAQVWELDGDYRHRLVHAAGGWRIDGLAMTWTFERGDRALLARAAERAKRS